MKLQLWDELLWQDVGHSHGPYAYCPEHRMKLDVLSKLGTGTYVSQDSQTLGRYDIQLVCPKDQKAFPLPPGGLPMLRRHFLAALEAIDLQNAEIVDVDGYQIPIAKADAPKKDDEYWAQVRINDTKRGKQLVVYAGKRGDRDKVQMFLDLENDKITFDQNNMHPNDVFVRVTGEFRNGRKTTMEE